MSHETCPRDRGLDLRAEPRGDRARPSPSGSPRVRESSRARSSSSAILDAPRMAEVLVEVWSGSDEPETIRAEHGELQPGVRSPGAPAPGLARRRRPDRLASNQATGPGGCSSSPAPGFPSAHARTVARDPRIEGRIPARCRSSDSGPFAGEYALYPIALLPLLFLLYPDGHTPSRRWRWAVVGLVGGTAIALLGFLFRPGPFNNWIEDGILFENPFGVDALAGIAPHVITVGAVVALVSALSTVFAVRQRFKRAAGRNASRCDGSRTSPPGRLLLRPAMDRRVHRGGQRFPDEDAPVFEYFFGRTALTIGLGIPAAYLWRSSGTACGTSTS